MLSFWLFIYSTNIYWAIVCSGSVLGASGRVSTGQTVLLSQSLVSTRIRKKRACALHTSSSLWLHLSLKLHTSLLLWDITQKTNIGTWLNDPNPCGISWVVMCQGRCHLLGTGIQRWPQAHSAHVLEPSFQALWSPESLLRDHSLLLKNRKIKFNNYLIIINVLYFTSNFKADIIN